MRLHELPMACKKKLIERLRAEYARGVTLSQEDTDLIHMETSEENLRYWKSQVQVADDADTTRIMHCQCIARSITIALRANDPTEENDHPMSGLLEEVFTRAGELPGTH